MILFKKSQPLTQYLQKIKSNTVSIGFVPTMGALHNGHISLIKKAKQQCDIIVCSVFVNPAQFNNRNDFEKYPVTIENDILLLENNQAGILFLPSEKEIYPEGTGNLMHFDIGYLENILEGFYRPNHFQGVCNVVHRLLNIVTPEKLFLGQKDYQQVLVLKKMMQSFHPNVKVFVEETLRETDGLAMSSRNTRLNDNARKNATAIYGALKHIKQNIEKDSFENLTRRAKEMILNNGFEKVDYVEICDAETLLPLDNSSAGKKLIVLAAAFICGVRLIDNIVL